MIASVIVDVLARQTDRPFDYIVPDEFAAWIEIGSRVGVPFGGRFVQGFVVGFPTYSDVDQTKLKPIEQLLDEVPPLTPALIELGRWMSEKYCCTMAAALQVMIPSALKGKAHTYVTVSDRFDEEETNVPWFIDVLHAGEPVSLKTLEQKFPGCANEVKQAIRDGKLDCYATIKDQLKIRKRTVVSLANNPMMIERLLQSTKSQQAKLRQLVSFLMDHEDDAPMPLKQLLGEASVSSSTVKTAAQKGYVVVKQEEFGRDPYAGRTFKRTEPLALQDGQRQAYEQISEAIDNRQSQVFLLHGITGSGKTEIYLQTIERCLRTGREAIVLVPEISLTPQMVERFKGRFGSQVAVLHSRLSSGERYDEWRKIRNRQVSIAIGARSAIFAPFERLGLVIMDEEHESSYKQEDSPKYHARDVSIWRARQNGAAVVLGSATPSLESYAATAHRGDPTKGATLISLPERALGQPLPPVTIVDMRDELKNGNRAMFSAPLFVAIQMRLERKEQCVLLLNRRGYSTFVMCRSCGYTAQCPHCDIALTYHQNIRLLRCHYCNYSEQSPQKCPTCESEHIRYFGTGTQKVEEQLAHHFPGIRVIRMDVDTTSQKGAHETLLSQFEQRQADVLLGTQMVAKGLDFPYVTLVGVIAADTSLHLPDFRAAERTFQLLTQVAGRAGRHHLPGEVIIQTYNPEHYALTTAQQHNYNAFLQHELTMRKQMGYPPFCRLISITLAHENQAKVIAASMELVTLIRQSAEQLQLSDTNQTFLDVLGPVAAPIARMKDVFRFQCMVKYRGKVDAVGIVRRAVASLTKQHDKSAVTYSVDVDPQMIM